jgi:hypothetical protein
MMSAAAAAGKDISTTTRLVEENPKIVGSQGKAYILPSQHD